jgi:hypothetical protein
MGFFRGCQCFAPDLRSPCGSVQKSNRNWRGGELRNRNRLTKGVAEFKSGRRFRGDRQTPPMPTTIAAMSVPEHSPPYPPINS